MNPSAVPVIYYHSVKYKSKDNWVHPYITMLLENFSKHLKLLHSLKMKTYFMDELYCHLKGEKKLPFNSLVVHFDDGYLDNYIFAYPLLKKYNIKATIWINPEFVSNDDNSLSPTLDDYWNGKYSLSELNAYDGFLNWSEMRLMEKSGLVDIQSHTMTHTKYLVSDKIIDFVSPNTKIDWLYWNLFPEDKANFLTAPNHKIPLGHPIYESQKGNIALKYEESGELTQELISYVKRNGSEKFFKNDSWRRELFELSNSLKQSKKNIYKIESQEEYSERVNNELLKSKSIIETKLGKTVNHVCWPYGAWNEMIVKLAENCGYLTSSMRGQKNIFNKQMPKRVDRIALDNPKYQNKLLYPYALYKIYGYKF